MRNRESSRHLQRVQNVIQKSREACGDDIEMQSHWAKYICVLSAGLIERGLQEIIIDFSTRKLSKPAANFILTRVTKIQNPKTETILNTIGAFKEEWRTELTAFVDEVGRRDAIDTIMDNRHKIAHGKSEMAGSISVIRITDYLDKAVQVLRFIENQLDR